MYETAEFQPSCGEFSHHPLPEEMVGFIFHQFQIILGREVCSRVVKSLSQVGQAGHSDYMDDRRRCIANTVSK